MSHSLTVLFCTKDITLDPSTEKCIMLTCVHNQNNIAICVCLALFRPSGNNCQRAFELTFALCSKHDYFICIRAGLYPLYQDLGWLPWPSVNQSVYYCWLCNISTLHTHCTIFPLIKTFIVFSPFKTLWINVYILFTTYTMNIRHCVFICALYMLQYIANQVHNKYNSIHN